MKKTLSAMVVLSGVVLIIAGCEGASTVAPPCSQNVDVAVATGPAPLIFWSPACGISQLTVSTVPPTGGGQPVNVWSFYVPENQPIGPFVTYGTAPAGATVTTQPQALVAGSTYRVQVFHTVGGDVLVSTGEATFTQ